MTWLSTWLARPPAPSSPQYAEHPTEVSAEAHAVELIRSGIARRATFYELGDSE